MITCEIVDVDDGFGCKLLLLLLNEDGFCVFTKLIRCLIGEIVILLFAYRVLVGVIEPSIIVLLLFCLVKYGE